MKDYNLRRLFEFTLARMNVYLSTAIRLFDFWYHSSQIFTYSFSFLPESGSLAYSQTLPIYWAKFKEFPSILNPFSSLEEPATFDMTLFYIQAHNFFREFFKAIKTFKRQYGYPLFFFLLICLDSVLLMLYYWYLVLVCQSLPLKS